MVEKKELSADYADVRYYPETSGQMGNVGHGCHFLRALLRNNEASLPLVESSLSSRRGRIFTTAALEKVRETAEKNFDRERREMMSSRRTRLQRSMDGFFGMFTFLLFLVCGGL